MGVPPSIRLYREDKSEPLRAKVRSRSTPFVSSCTARRLQNGAAPIALRLPLAALLASPRRFPMPVECSAALSDQVFQLISVNAVPQEHLLDHLHACLKFRLHDI